MRLIVPISLCLLSAVDPTFAVDEAQSEGDRTAKANPRDDRASQKILTTEQWQQLDRTVNRGLEFLATQQTKEGSFRGPPVGQPGITSLCVLAFLSRGHLPGQGPYGEQIDRAVDFVLSTQRSDGLLSHVAPTGWRAQKTALYNHGIAGLMLSEVYGMSGSRQHERIRKAITRAIAFSRDYQRRYVRNRHDRGGWRYMQNRPGANADLSVTSWQLMFLRSARGAEFEVPKQVIDEALACVKHHFDRRSGTFFYRLRSRYNPRSTTGAMVGAGIVSLSLGGEHQTETARRAGKWVLAYPVERYNRIPNGDDRYHYSIFYCSQGMFLLGGEYWAGFYPRLLRTLAEHQRHDGSWQAEASKDNQYGNVYTSALSILALTPPYQLLPIYQR